MLDPLFSLRVSGRAGARAQSVCNGLNSLLYCLLCMFSSGAGDIRHDRLILLAFNIIQLIFLAFNSVPVRCIGWGRTNC